MNSMNGGLLYADKPTTHGRARLSRALLTLAIPPLACGFVIGLSWGSIGGVFVGRRQRAGIGEVRAEWGGVECVYLAAQ